MMKNQPANAGDLRGSVPGQEDLLRRPWRAAPVFLPGESCGQRSQGRL